MDFQIERTRDVNALSAVACATFLQTYAHMISYDNLRAHNESLNAPEAYQKDLDKGAAAWLVRIAKTQAPVGFALLTAPDLPDIETAPGDVELKRIYLLHRFHGAGLGKRLLDSVEEVARAQSAPRLLLGVYHENPTINWYRRQGFAKLGERAFTVGAETFHDLILGKAL